MALPFALTGFAFGLALWREEELLSFETWRRSPQALALAGVVVGGLAFLNTWDLPTFGFLIALLVLARNWIVHGAARPALRATAGFALPLAAVSILLYLPFYVGFSSQAGFVDAVRNGATRPSQAFLFWGAIMAVALPLPLYLLFRDGGARTRVRVLRTCALPVALLILWAVLLVARHGPPESARRDHGSRLELADSPVLRRGARGGRAGPVARHRGAR